MSNLAGAWVGPGVGSGLLRRTLPLFNTLPLYAPTYPTEGSPRGEKIMLSFFVFTLSPPLHYLSTVDSTSSPRVLPPPPSTTHSFCPSGRGRRDRNLGPGTEPP